MPDLASDEHAAEAEKLLRQAARPNLDDAAVQALAQMANAHTQLALLASRPAEIRGEPEPTAVHARKVDHLEKKLAVTVDRLDVALSENMDLGWLVGHLAHNAPDTVMLPPRLASLVKACMDGYEPSRFTLAAPVPSTGEDQAEPGYDLCGNTPLGECGSCELPIGHASSCAPSTGEDQASTRGMSGAERIARERARQIEAEGWTPEHDDQHEPGQLVDAAACYALQQATYQDRPWTPDPEYGWQAPPLWPWAPSWWKPSDDPIRNLEKAGALIAAEIDRLLRLPVPDEGSKTDG